MTFVSAAPAEPLAGLNPAQREAVLHVDGPLLVLAGAGSGKTRVLTTRIAHLVREHGVDPSRILAVTFTNKAAGEMRERLTRLLGGAPTGMWVGTFHAIGARLVRANAALVGRTPQFTIYDEDDTLAVVKRVMEAAKISPKEWTPKVIHRAISDAKNALVAPAEYASLANDPLSRAASTVYTALEGVMRGQNAVDFDDLLVLPVEFLRAHAATRDAYASRFRYVLVDEYQDTNRAQYALIKLLGAGGNVAVVGDDDQCLVEGTIVTMADGSVRPIESIRAGDEVLSGYGSGVFRPARVARVHARTGRRDGIAITTQSGRRLVSTPEHTHFAGYKPADALRAPTAIPSRAENEILVALTLCADRDGSLPVHRMSTSGGPDWRFDVASTHYGALIDAVDRIDDSRDVVVRQFARLGRNEDAGVLESNSLPFTTAGSVMPGMALFTGDGGYDIVATVERVTINSAVFDLDVERTHNYIADGIVTHNSIYGWRGADIRNILDFEKDFAPATVVRLEENYRSTKPILDLANVVIAPNTQRLGKTLRTTRGGGARVGLVRAADERDEAQWVVDDLLTRRRADSSLLLREVVLLYRTNAQSRAFEEALRRQAIPYRVVGAVRFYDRREIRDLMSYLKLIANPADDEAFRRAVAVPRRGIGDGALASLAEAATGAGVPLLAAAGRADLLASVRPGPRTALLAFAAMIADLRRRATDAGVDELLEAVVDATRYGDFVRADNAIDAPDRLDNIRELIASAAETVVDDGGEVGLTPLDHFLQRASLVAAIDQLDPSADAVAMMTIHNAKGLEFPVVYVTGLEDGLFPLSRAYDDPRQLEEERRLLYVAVTRAERVLTLTYADHRRRNGELLPGKPSLFLSSIPPAMLDRHETVRARSEGRSAFATYNDRTGATTTGASGAATRRAGVPVTRSHHGPVGFTDDADGSQDAPAYRVGEAVRHRAFGSGTIAEVSGTGRDLKVKIDFEDAAIGRKTLVVAQAGLQRGWD